MPTSHTNLLNGSAVREENKDNQGSRAAGLRHRRGFSRRSSGLVAAILTSLALLMFGVPAGNAAGGPASGFTIPAGISVSFTAGQINACNVLQWGYQLNGGPLQQMGAKTDGACTSIPQPDLTIGPFSTPQTLRLYLTDVTCGVTYYSDGAPVDHVNISGSNPYLVRFADGGGFCERATTALTDFSGANWSVTVNDPSTPAEQLVSLINQVNGMGFPAGIQNALAAKLKAAQTDTGATQCGDLTAFINQVNAQAGKTITTSQAASLAADAKLIQSLLHC